MKTGYLTNSHYREHLTGQGHPESPDRLDSVDRKIGQAGLSGRLYSISPRVIDLKWIYKVHHPSYISRLIGFSPTSDLIYLDPDTPVSPRSFSTALLAAGGVCQAVDDVQSGLIQNAFCAVRPPGHHARISTGMGFCLVNNIAVAARYAQERYGIKKVAILDWDVHHGNGTQEIFYKDPSVFYFSIHQYPFYPGTGNSKEIGELEGEGTTLNVPLDSGSGDKEYLRVFEDVLAPKIEMFQPELILISAGFDAHKNDPLAQMEISTEGFGRMTRVVKQLAEKVCSGKIISVLEGGYNLEALGDSVVTHLKVLLE